MLLALRREQGRATALARERDRLESAMAFLGEQPTLLTRASARPVGPAVRVFVAPQRGFALIGSGLPRIESDRIFELWLVPTAGAPQPAGLVRARGANCVYVSNARIDLARTKAIAISVEPESGSSSPTTPPFVAVPLS